MPPVNQPQNSNTPMAKSFKIFAFIATICVAGVLGGLIVIVDSKVEVRDAKLAAESNNRILNIIVAFTGCLPEDSPEICQAKKKATDVKEGTRRIAEVDCIHRRSLVGLPAPEPTRFCTEQTPPEIYPGK